MATYYVGWDVGAWNCGGGKKSQSHDAIAVMNDKFEFVSCGLGNIKESLRDSKNFAGFLSKFAVLDKEGKKASIKFKEQDDQFIIAIDAVLGWPTQFLRLLTEPPNKNFRKELDALFPDGTSIKNQFLFRQTEREVAKMPLSAVKDQIGSQSTKAIFLLKYLGFSKEKCSAWKDNTGNIAIETYPGAVSADCKNKIQNKLNDIKLTISSNYSLFYSAKRLKKDLLWGVPASQNGEKVKVIDIDLQDAIVCAWIAKLYADKNCAEPKKAEKSESAAVVDYPSEGWIFLPKQ